MRGWLDGVRKKTKYSKKNQDSYNCGHVEVLQLPEAQVLSPF